MKMWKGYLEATAKKGRQGGDLANLVAKGGGIGACKLLGDIRGLEVGSIRSVQGIGYGVLEFLGIRTTHEYAGRLRCKGVTKQIIGVVPKGLALRVVLVDLHSKDESGKRFKLEVN
ncbi:hypothetical protein Tco_1162849 [Tanacetum coccineum]